MKQWFYILSILYALSPMDLVPERIFGPPGFIDDILVIGALYWYYIYRPVMPEARRGAAGRGGKERDEAPRENPAGSRLKDPYEILGLARGATDEEIKHAYRELAKKYHPDKVSHLGDEFRDLANMKFKEIQRAYQELISK